MKLGLFLFLVGVYGIIFNRKNLILMIISIELMLLAVTLVILFNSYYFNDLFGQIYALYILTIAGAESVIGLSILVVFYRLRGTITIKSDEPSYSSSSTSHFNSPTPIIFSVASIAVAI